MSEFFTHGKFVYSIGEDFSVSVWDMGYDPETTPPSIYQPFHPNTGLAFASVEEAMEWTNDYFEYLQQLPPPKVVLPEMPELPDPNHTDVSSGPESSDLPA